MGGVVEGDIKNCLHVTVRGGLLGYLVVTRAYAQARGRLAFTWAAKRPGRQLTEVLQGLTEILMLMRNVTPRIVRSIKTNHAWFTLQYKCNPLKVSTD